MEGLVPVEAIASRIYLIRQQRVILDRDLAELYGVETRALTQAVRRNMRRFPDDFMFILEEREFNLLMSQSVISKTTGRGGTRKPPMAFTEQGVAMLSSVLKSERAIEVNIAIMRAFVQMRQMLTTHADLKRKIEEMESKYDEQFQIVFEAIRQLLADDEKPKKRIGF
ncbi:MAG: ORF6N domain-containing protein [Thermodesulfobacteriota bacterium]